MFSRINSWHRCESLESGIAKVFLAFVADLSELLPGCSLSLRWILFIYYNRPFLWLIQLFLQGFGILYELLFVEFEFFESLLEIRIILL